MNSERLRAVREGDSGASLVLYLDLPDDLAERWQEQNPGWCSVLAVGEALSLALLGLLKHGPTGDPAELAKIDDQAAAALRVLLTAGPERQALALQRIYATAVTPESQLAGPVGSEPLASDAAGAAIAEWERIISA